MYAPMRINRHLERAGHVALVAVSLDVLEARRHDRVERLRWGDVHYSAREDFACRRWRNK